MIIVIAVFLQRRRTGAARDRRLIRSPDRRDWAIGARAAIEQAERQEGMVLLG